jgi:hypothetical protein
LGNQTQKCRFEARWGNTFPGPCSRDLRPCPSSVRRSQTFLTDGARRRRVSSLRHCRRRRRQDQSRQACAPRRARSPTPCMVPAAPARTSGAFFIYIQYACNHFLFVLLVCIAYWLWLDHKDPGARDADNDQPWHRFEKKKRSFFLLQLSIDVLSRLAPSLTILSHIFLTLHLYIANTYIKYVIAGHRLRVSVCVHAFVVFSGAPSVIDECRAAIATMRAVAADFGGDWPQTVALVDARDAGIVTGRVALGVCVLSALSLYCFTSDYSNYNAPSIREKKEKKTISSHCYLYFFPCPH